MISQQTIDDMIKTHDVQLLIFDCDGTLMETLSLHYQAWRDAFVSHGLSFIDEEEFIREYAGVSGGRMVAAVIAQLNYALDVKTILESKKKIFLQQYIMRVTPIQKTFAIVKKYHGKLPMVVASGGAKEAVAQMLHLNDVFAYFKQVFAIEDVTQGKPAPDVFLKAAHDQGVLPENCLVFEDHFAGFAAAKSAGMRYIDVNQLLDY
jgi:beta-phosphoglucomutase-like phosphatase (HAD superfamily)